jgi:uncharacterized phiE125 gp8 family phage protein
MALPTVTQCKTYLRIQGSADDTLIGDLLTRATAMVRGALGRPLALESRTFTDYAETRRAYGTVTALLIPGHLLPCVRVDGSTETAPVITDADGLVLDPAVDYYVGAPWDATLRARPGLTFGVGPYTVAVDSGLAAADDYADVIEPALSGAIIDVVADLYQRRSPAASSESTGGGVSTSYDARTGLPMRVWQQISQWAVIRA